MSLYFEDMAPGQIYRGTKVVTVTADAIKRFAAEFDPQPFHLDETLAKATFFQGLAASGWHTAAMTMRLAVDSDFKPQGGIVGAGMENLVWPRPVRAGDTLRVESEILEARESKTRPGIGLVKLRTTTLNQKDEPVQTYVATLVVPKRPIARA